MHVCVWGNTILDALLRIANTNMYHDIFVLVPALKMEGEGMLLLLAVSSSSPPGGIDCSRVLGHKWNPMLGHNAIPFTSALPHQLAVT